jgi:beta-glucosidase/6-phospho-beta-glucosidase/beta-galactosidase
MTMNEPWIYARMAHSAGEMAPYLKEPETVYEVIHNLLIAHSKTYRLYEAKFKGTQNGKVGISVLCIGFEPASNSSEDLEATQVAYEFKVSRGKGLFILRHRTYKYTLKFFD